MVELLLVGTENYAWIPDGNGQLHLEDLNAEAPLNFEVKVSDVTFHFYPEAKDATLSFTLDTIEEFLATSLLNPEYRNFFIIHGWRNDRHSPVNTEIRKSLERSSKENVFVVDWGGLSMRINYVTAKISVPKVGDIVGEVIRILNARFPLSTYMLVGHSLGGHVAGHAGALLGGNLDFILGLDPASFLFSKGNSSECLDKSDAKVVHVIHTSIWGLQESLGHADYFPNGGLTQPGCFMDLLSVCAHSRSYLYFAESIGSHSYRALKCEGYDQFQMGSCDGNDESFMGGLYLDRK